ncbi:hypothetical protein OFB72_26025, partial [Escherichia coli]|nr:hypothetical protein [Escherichia coli]
MALYQNVVPQSPSAMAELWTRGHITNKLPSDVRHRDLLEYLEKLRLAGLKVEQVGLSQLQREIYQIE